MDPKLFGTDSLADKLMSVMQSRIEDQLPLIKDQIDKKLKETKEGMEVLGTEPPLDKKEISLLVGDIMQAYLQDYSDRLEGDQIEDSFSEKPYGPGFLYNLFFNFAKELESSAHVKVEWKKLEALMLNSASLPGFAPLKVFKKLVRERNESIKYPCYSLVEQVAAHVSLLGEHARDHLKGNNFHNLLLRIEEATNTCVEEIEKTVKNQLTDFLSSQDFVFTASGEYEELSKPINMHTDKKDGVVPTQTTKRLGKFENKILNASHVSRAEVITALHAYMKQKRGVAEDAVPQIVGYRFTDRGAFLSTLRHKLDEIRMSPNIEQLIIEPNKVRCERNKLKQERDVLMKAKAVLQNFNFV